MVCPGLLPASPGLGVPSIGDLRQRSATALPALKFSCSKKVRALPVWKPTHLRYHPPPSSSLSRELTPWASATRPPCTPSPATRPLLPLRLDPPSEPSTGFSFCRPGTAVLENPVAAGCRPPIFLWPGPPPQPDAVTAPFVSKGWPGSCGRQVAPGRMTVRRRPVSTGGAGRRLKQAQRTAQGRLPTEASLGGQASRPRGNWTVRFALRIWTDCKCAAAYRARRAGRPGDASEGWELGRAASSHGHGHSRHLPAGGPPPRPCTQSWASERQLLGRGTRPPAKRRPLSTSDINQTHPDNDQWRRLGREVLAGLQAHLQPQES